MRWDLLVDLELSYVAQFGLKITAMLLPLPPNAKILGMVLFVSVTLSRAETQGLAYASQTLYLELYFSLSAYSREYWRKGENRNPTDQLNFLREARAKQ